jgi:hypothetical protein
MESGKEEEENMRERELLANRSQRDEMVSIK